MVTLSTRLTFMEEPLEEMIWQVRRLFRELQQEADRALAPLGVTAAERALLEFLAMEDAPVGLSEIARRRAVSRQHIHQSLARLDPRWVERSNDPEDARTVVLALSREGRAVWQKIRRVDATLLRRLGKRLDAEEIRAATATLRAVRQALPAAQEKAK